MLIQCISDNNKIDEGGMMTMNKKMMAKIKENLIMNSINEKEKNEVIENGMLFNLGEKHFKNGLLEILMIGMRPEYQESLFNSTSKEEFLAKVEEPLTKAKFISNKTASSMERDKLINEINELLPEFIHLLDQKSFEIEAYIQGEASLTSRALAKCIYCFTLELVETIKKCKLEEAQEWVADLISSSDDILCYLGFKHFHSLIETYKFSRAKKQWIMPIAVNYTNLFSMQQALLMATSRLKELIETTENLSKENAKKDKAIEVKKNDLAKLNEKMAEMALKLKQKEKQTVIKEFENLNLELEAEKIRYALLDKDYQILTKKIALSDLNKNKQAEIEQLNNAIEISLKENEKLKSKLAERQDADQNWQEYNLMTELILFLDKNGMTSGLRILVEPYLNMEIEIQPELECDLQIPSSDYFGYCEVTDKGHFVTSLNGIRRPLGEIPEDLYLGQGQIVLVDENSNLLQSFFYQYSTNEYLDTVKSIALLEEGENGLEVVTAEEERLPYANRTTYTLQAGRIVGLNASGEVIKSYKPIKFNADFFLESACVRGQHVYALEKTVGDCLLVKEVPEGIMKVIPMPSGMNASLDDFSILFVKGAQLIKSFKSLRFFTSSSFYTKREYVTISVDDKGIFFERLNGERRLLGQLSVCTSLESGDVVAVDEYMNYIEKQIQKEMDLKSLEKAISVKKAKNAGLSQCDEDADLENEALCELHPERILIVGDEGMQQSYKLTLFKSGYAAEVVSGVDSWHKIAKAVRQNDVIVFVTDFAKHQHYYKFKEEFSDKNVIYAAFEGANRIVSLLNEKFRVTMN